MILEAVLVGHPAPLANGALSAIAKAPASGPVTARRLGLDGDTQADSKYHGGPDKAVHMYALDHYPAWRVDLGRAADSLLSRAGAFGENLAARGITESDVCIGDRWRAGSALLELSQGRQPCWKLNHRFGHADMAKRVQETGRTGWYFRVIEEGDIAAGDSFTLEARPNAAWSVKRILDVFYRDTMNRDALSEIADLPFLAENWRRLALRRLQSRAVENWSLRLEGSAQQST